jgi:signal transduction histidine kinase
LIRDRDGNPSSVVSIVQDTTERKRAEESLQEADRRKDEFLATLAHELRNPLAPICNSLHILRLAGGDAASQEDVVEMMERQVRHMVRLVDDLLEVSRITRGKIELRKEPIELAAVVRSAVEASKPLMEAAGHQLAITLPREPILLNADPVRVAQVFANLLNNAAKYTDPGGQIRLTAKVQAGQTPQSGVTISVSDTGIGISPAMLPRVFDMFAQSDSSHHRAKGGLGIGLTLVKELVHLHGGSVEAHSEGAGMGSEFVVHLPLAEKSPSEAADVPAHSTLPHSHYSQLSILVVDDNRDAADSLGMILKRLGLNVRVVYDGLAALEALATYRPSVVLLDIGMPGMDGYEVIRQARLQPKSHDVVSA